MGSKGKGRDRLYVTEVQTTVLRENIISKDEMDHQNKDAEAKSGNRRMLLQLYQSFVCALE